VHLHLFLEAKRQIGTQSPRLEEYSAMWSEDISNRGGKLQGHGKSRAGDNQPIATNSQWGIETFRGIAAFLRGKITKGSRRRGAYRVHEKTPGKRMGQMSTTGGKVDPNPIGIFEELCSCRGSKDRDPRGAREDQGGTRRNRVGTSGTTIKGGGPPIKKWEKSIPGSD